MIPRKGPIKKEEWLVIDLRGYHLGFMSAILAFFLSQLFHPLFALILLFLWWSWKLKTSPYFWSWMVAFVGGVLGLM